MRNPLEFQLAVTQLQIKSWRIHDCGICGYLCGFIFRGNVVYYDGACDCVSSDLRNSSFDAVAEHYNVQKSPEVIKEYDKFWGFDQDHVEFKKLKDGSLSDSRDEI